MLDWFTTIPGILIICGVILLVIAIILFVVGAKKSKKEGVATTETMNKPLEEVPAMETANEAASVTIEPVSPSVDINTVSTEEPIQISEPEQEIITIEEPVSQQPVVETPIMDMPSVSEMPVVEENNSTIYGGEAPTVDFSVSEEKPVTIYGGNDPLEATQTLPKVEEHHEPYGGAYPEARIVEPVQSIEMPTPVEEVVSAMPTVEPVFDINTDEPEVQVSSVEPTVEPMPVVEPIPTAEVEVPEVTSDVAEPTPVTIPTQEEVNTSVEEL